MWRKKDKETKVYDRFREFVITVLGKTYPIILQIDMTKGKMADLSRRENEEKK